MVMRNHQLSTHSQKSRSKPIEQDTSWHGVSEWYSKLVGDRGHYYHQQVIFPNLNRLWKSKPHTRVLDFGCGQGVLAAWLNEDIEYVGVDAAQSLVSEAKQKLAGRKRQFIVADATKDLTHHLPHSEYFTDVFCMLSLQNMRDQQACIANAYKALQPGGHLHLVLNHPCFRIPRQSGWSEHEKTRQVYRWINRYLTPQEIPISAHPGSNKSSITWSFHRSLSDYSRWCAESGFLIELIEEWASDKVSKGKVAKQENLVRAEIPLFMYISARK